MACRERKLLAPSVRKVDSAIHWINYYPLNSAIGFPNTLWIAISPVDSAIHLLNNRGLAKISIPYLQFLLLSASLRLSLDFYVAPLLSLLVAHDRSTIATVIFFSPCVQTEPNATSISGTPPLRGHLPSRSRGYSLNKGSNEGNFFYYMEKSVLLGTKPLVDSIRHFIRDPSGVFSVCHLCECRIVQ